MSSRNLFPVDPKGLEDIAAQLLDGTPEPLLPLPADPIQLSPDGFYKFSRATLQTALSDNYKRLLREGGYLDIDRISELGIAKSMLKINPNVRRTAQTINYNLQGNDDAYVTNIDQPDARRLVQALGGKLLTTFLMYKVFIPYLKQEKDRNPEAAQTLKEMIETKAEWMDDIVLDKTKVKIGSAERILIGLPQKDGRFGRGDINNFGYPTQVKKKGEFYYWHPSGTERAAIRDWNSELSLDLDGGPSFALEGLGVRLAKIFS